MRAMTVTLWMLLLGAGLMACGGGGGAEEAGGGESTSGGDEAAYAGPITSTEVERGKELFSTHCDDCHPGGEEDVGPSLIADPHTPPSIRKQIREGSGKMRPFPEKCLEWAERHRKRTLFGWVKTREYAAMRAKTVSVQVWRRVLPSSHARRFPSRR